MKAITICQPYAHLICLPETDPRHKRVENRTWPTHYRGPILIHAGKSRDWLIVEESGVDLEYEIPVSDMAFGAVVATAWLVDCIHFSDILSCMHDFHIYPWLSEHKHTEGPWCWVLADVVALPVPVPARGAQGLWNMEWPL